MSHDVNSPSELNEFLINHKLAGIDERPIWKQLAGGVSSDIWRVELSDRTICVKRALPSLKVEADWRAPIIRNQYEWEWFKFVYSEFPQFVPQPLAHDQHIQVLAMEYLAPALHAVWKKELLAGQVDSKFASQVGKRLGMIHSRSAGVRKVKETFSTDPIFHALRIEPYLLATAERHPELREVIIEIAGELGETHLALVHGDISPKNILVGPDGPIFLDAECAWYGDPAFDLAFCLNHLLLKCAVLPGSVNDLIISFEELLDGYFGELDWEPREVFERRCARLLPVLFLARVDGKSPVEYIVDENLKDLVRKSATRFIPNEAQRLSDIAAYWRAVIAKSGVS